MIDFDKITRKQWIAELKKQDVESLFELCHVESYYPLFPLIYFDKTSTKNLDKKKKILIKFLSGKHLTYKENHDKDVFELIPDNVDDIIFN